MAMTVVRRLSWASAAVGLRGGKGRSMGFRLLLLWSRRLRRGMLLIMLVAVAEGMGRVRLEVRGSW